MPSYFPFACFVLYFLFRLYFDYLAFWDYLPHDFRLPHYVFPMIPTKCIAGLSPRYISIGSPTIPTDISNDDEMLTHTTEWEEEEMEEEVEEEEVEEDEVEEEEVEEEANERVVIRGNQRLVKVPGGVLWRARDIASSSYDPIVLKGTAIRSVLEAQGHSGLLLRREKPEFLMPWPKNPFARVSSAEVEDSKGSEEPEENN